MSWTYEKFEVGFTTVYLPPNAPQEDVDTGDSSSSFMDLATGGGFDELGDRDSWPGVLRINRRGKYLSDNVATCHAKLAALKALSGAAGKLWRWNVESGERQWCRARLARVVAPFAPGNDNYIEAITTFDRTSRAWNGVHRGFGYTATFGIATFDGSFSFDDVAEKYALPGSSATSIVVENHGDAEVSDIVFTLHAGSTTITSVTYVSTGVKWVWTGNLAAGKDLVIDDAGKTVLIDGNSAYYGYGGGGTGFKVDTALHLIPRWMRLTPAYTGITITIVGGGTGCYAHFDFYEAHK